MVFRPISPSTSGRVVFRRISIVCGALLRYDAISECALACLEAVSQSDHFVEARLFCLESDVADSRVHVVGSVRELTTDPFYQGSDVIIHHFGIFNELHNALAVAPRSAHVIVQFYGVTPPQFVAQRWAGLINDSFIQIGLFENADEIVVNSQYLNDELDRIGITKPTRRIELFGVNIDERYNRASIGKPRDGLEVVYCGRFVESKQVLPLIQSMQDLSGDFMALTLRLIGVEKYSDESYLKEIKAQVAVSSLDVVFDLNRTSDQVAAAIKEADILVLPSKHEGFGMPVAEALAALTPVVCSDAGSLPEVAGGLALLFSSNDSNALTETLRKALEARAAGDVLTERGRFPYALWAAEARSFSIKYRRESFIDRWRALVTDVMVRVPSHQLSASMRRDAVRSVLQHQDVHDPGEAQLLGRIVAEKVLRRLEVDPTDAIEVLHRWAFGRPMEENDLHYWSTEYSREGFDGIVTQFSRSEQVCSSSLRLRSLTGLKAALREYEAARSAGSIAPQSAGLPTMGREDVDKILSHSSTPLEFVKGAYALILGREPDASGLATFLPIAAKRENWDGVIDSLYDSGEYAIRTA